MLRFLELDSRNHGKMLTVTSVQNSGNRQFNNNRTLNRRPIQTEDSMKNNTKRFVALVGFGLALIMPIRGAFAQSLEQLSAPWWQWALSIPTSVNPQLDKTGKDAVVGQRSSVWFLAGVFGGGTVTRACSVPQGTALFLPVINSVNINTPKVCGQKGPLTVEKLRALSAAFIDGAANLSVTLDGVAITNLQRVKSGVFAVALPEDNVFDSPCAGLGGVPAGIYSPAVDDGFYVLLNPLSVGGHTLHFHAENPSQGFTQDVTYNLTVVPVSLK
jgi:hypothetical protein